MSSKWEYEVFILMGEETLRENPSFFFDNRKEAYAFAETCLDNQYNVAISKR